MKQKCIIAGAGPAGIDIAALLAKLKPELDLMVLEKEYLIGGLAKCYEINGAWYDNGCRWSAGPGDTPGLSVTWPSQRLAEIIDANVTYEVPPAGVMAYLSSHYPGEQILMSSVVPGHPSFKKDVAKRIFPYLNDDVITECEKVLQAGEQEMMTSKAFQDFVNSGWDHSKAPKETLDEWLSQHCQTPLAAKFLKQLSSHLGGTPLSEAGLNGAYIAVYMYLIACPKDWVRWAQPVNPNPPYYGKWAAEPYAFRDTIVKNGGKILTNSPVRKIIIEKGKVKGVVAQSEGREVTIETDLVITDIPLIEALDSGVIDEKQVPEQWVKDIRETWDFEKKSYSCGFVVAQYLVDKVMLDNKFWTVFLDAKGDFQGSIDSGRNPHSAPPGKEVITLQSFFKVGEGGEKEKLNLRTAYEAIDEYLLPNMRLHFPDFDDHVEFSTLHCVPHGWVQAFVYNNNTLKLSPIRVPGVEGLYCVGSWCDAGWIGSFKCAYSALLCAQMLTGEKLV